jgi:hypothetical protein
LPDGFARRDQAIDARLDIVAPDAGKTVREGEHDRDEQPPSPNSHNSGKDSDRLVLAKLTSSVP